MTLNHSQVNVCCRMTHSRKYFVSGSDNGVVRIQEAPVPGQLLGNDDESRYWEVRFGAHHLNRALNMVPIPSYHETLENRKRYLDKINVSSLTINSPSFTHVIKSET